MSSLCADCEQPIVERSHNARYCLGCAGERPKCQVCTALVQSPGLTVCNSHVRHQLGISYRQLDYWTRTGRLHPELPHGSGSGTWRSWPDAELAAARLMGRLTAAGIPIGIASKVARSGDSRCEIAPGIVIEVTG